MARIASDSVTEMLSPFRRACALSLTLASVFTACASHPHDNGPLFGTGILHPPPKPGASISQTRMCECQACAPRSCCEGPEDDAPSASCGQDGFEGGDECTISVRSCVSRCIREVWRVNQGEDCASKQPESCCRAG